MQNKSAALEINSNILEVKTKELEKKIIENGTVQNELKNLNNQLNLL